MTDKPIDFDAVIFAAYDRTEACPDGYRAEFCPRCFIKEFNKVIEELRRCGNCGNWIIDTCRPCYLASKRVQ